ncbi:MAG TPA: hypothetical protein ENH34_05575 [Phycisphaerales bacterium]|nr:hypothetical protein [Phycisphaerales bacterium]
MLEPVFATVHLNSAAIVKENYIITNLIVLLKTDAKVISSEGLAEAEAEKSIKKTDFSTLFASLTTVEMTSFQQSEI